MSNRKTSCAFCKHRHGRSYNFRPFYRLFRAYRKKRISRADFVRKYKLLQIYIGIARRVDE